MSAVVKKSKTRHHKVKVSSDLSGVSDAPAANIDVKLVMDFPDTRRPIDPEAVRRLAKSIARRGLKTPIDVLRIQTGMMRRRYKLIAGAHRLEAFKELDRSTIPARILTKDDALAWEEEENLLNSDLNVLDKSIAIVRYAKKLKLSGDDATAIGGQQPHDKGISKVAKASGFDRKRVTEAYAHNDLTKKVKLRIRALGLENNRKILTCVARLQSTAEQLEFLDRSDGQKKSLLRKAEKQRSVYEVPKASVDKIAGLKLAWKSSFFKQTFDREEKEVQRAFLRFLLT